MLYGAEVEGQNR